MNIEILLNLAVVILMIPGAIDCTAKLFKSKRKSANSSQKSADKNQE